jgi:hypothetical protein
VNVFTGKEMPTGENGQLKLRDVFADFPVAILRSKASLP